MEQVRFCRNLAADERPHDGGAFVTFAAGEDAAGDKSAAAACAAATEGKIPGDAGPAGVKMLAQVGQARGVGVDQGMVRRLGGARQCSWCGGAARPVSVS